jgi:hypothetical protein
LRSLRAFDYHRTHRITVLEREGGDMQVFDLFAWSQERRLDREREARIERSRPRPVRAERAVPAAEKHCGCGAPAASRPTSA